MIVSVYKIDELEVGMEAEITKEITKKEIESFSTLTGDFHPLHNNFEYASKHGYPDIIAHGLLISSLCSTLIGMRLPGENALVMGQSFKYLNPVYPGDNLLINGKIDTLDKRFSMISVKVKVINQHEKIVAKGKFQIKVRS